MAAPMKKSVELFYDVVSPYTWFAFEVICRYRKTWDIDLKLKPFFLGGIMNGADNRPPGFVPNKAQYMQTELPLLAKYFSVPLTVPENIAELMFVKGTLQTQRFITTVDMETPHLTEEVSRQMWLRAWSRNPGFIISKGSLSAQRFLTAVDMMYPEFLEQLTRELWLRVWSRGEDITEPDSLMQAGKMAGLSDEQIQNSLGRIKDQAVKDRLKQYTDEALSHGAFGSPTMIARVDGKPQMVFGSDRFPLLAQVLDEKWEGPVPAENRARL